MPSEYFLNPLELFFLWLLASLAFVKFWPALNRIAGASGWLTAAAALMVLNYFAIVVYYINSPGFFDHGEVMVPAWSWMLNTGHPLYNSIDDASRYSTIYGPMGNILYACAMAMLGPSVFTCKLAAGLAGMLAVFFSWRAYSKAFTPKIAWFGAGLVALLFLTFAFQTFMTKHDPFLVLFAAVALWAALALPSIPGGILIAVCLGIEVNLKLHGFLYILPSLCLYWRRFQLKPVALICAGSLVVAALPFLHPQISFADWLAGLRSEGGLGLGRVETMANVQWFAFLWLPFPFLFLISSRRSRQGFADSFSKQKLFLLTLFACTVLTGFIGSKVASGPAHFVPLIPLLVYAFGRFLGSQLLARENELKLEDRAAQACLAAFLATALFLSGHQQYRFLSSLSVVNRNSEVVTADLLETMNTLKGKKVSMGYGSNQTFFLSQNFLPLVFSNQPYYFNFSSMMGFHDHFLSRKSREVILEKKVDVWLIPRNDEPFRIRSFYVPNPEMFDDAFRTSFAENYERRSQSRFYDLYFAKGS